MEQLKIRLHNLRERFARDDKINAADLMDIITVIVQELEKK